MKQSAPATSYQQPSGTDSYAGFRGLAFAMFFLFGSITSLNDVLIPKLKSLFSLTYSQAMLVQSAFFLAYFIASIPAGLLIVKLGYLRSAALGMLTMALGCLLFIPAASVALFPAFLFALFILATGVTCIQVVANPLLTFLGRSATVSSRMTLGHGFNSLGTTIAPYAGAMLILSRISEVDSSQLSSSELVAFLKEEASVISHTYMGIAALLFVVALFIWRIRNRLKIDIKDRVVNVFSAFDLLKRSRFLFGFIGLFLYVGAEVTIGSVLVNYMMQKNIFRFSAEVAGKHVALYWGGAMIGRFIGAVLLRYFSPGKLLAIYALIVVLLIASAMLSQGHIAGWSILAIGLFNSIMFPTIFSLASEGLGERAAEGSGLICCSIVGGGLIPPLTGLVADMTTLNFSLIVPGMCYLGIFLFGIFTLKRHLTVTP